MTWISRFESLRDVAGKPHNLSPERGWDELLGNPIKARCDGPPCPHGCTGKERVTLWAPTIFAGGKRRNELVVEHSALVFDIDGAPLALAHRAFDQLSPLGLEAVAHTTHKQGSDPTKIWLRVVFPLSKPRTPRELSSIREALLERVPLLESIIDRSAFDPARIFFLPAEGTEGAFRFTHHLGVGVDTLAESQAEAARVPHFELKRKIVRGASEDLKPYLQGKGLPMGAQDNLLQRIASRAVYVAPGATNEAILHVMHACLAKTDWREPGGLEHLEVEFIKKLNRARIDYSRQQPAPQATTQADPLEWEKQLKRGPRGRITPTLSNAERILENTSAWNSLRWDSRRCDFHVTGTPLEGSDKDVFPARFSVWLSNNYGFELSVWMAEAALQLVARKRPFDYAREDLNALPAWDGVLRLSDWLKTYLGARGDPETLRAFGRAFLVGFVRRIFEPGCKADCCLILEGSQGIGKSTALRILAGEGFTDQPLDIRDKDSLALLSRYSLIEIAEGFQLGHKASEDLKAFLSSAVDTYRRPYARSASMVPRASVVAVTTNERVYLPNDPTGARRFWPVRCGDIDTVGLRRDRMQLLAEAVAAYRAGEPNWLEGESAEAAQAEAQDRQHEDQSTPLAVRIEEWLATKPDNAQFTAKDVAVECLAMADRELTNPGAMRSVHRALGLLPIVRRHERNKAGGKFNRPLYSKAPKATP